MAHEIEEFEDGSAAFVSVREPAWHGLGTVLDNRMTTKKALNKAHLANWNVRKVPIIAPTDAETVEKWREAKEEGTNYPLQGSTMLDVSKKTEDYLILRDHPVSKQPDLLSIMGERYTPVQNEEAFSFIDALLDTDEDAYWETAGSIRKGRVVFGCLALPENTIVLDENGAADQTRVYLMVVTSHDGTFGVTAAVTPVRVVCQNTLRVAMRNAKNSWSIRHTQNVQYNIAEAKKALKLTHRYTEAFEEEARKLFETSMTDQMFYEIMKDERVFGEPDPDSKAAQTRWDNKVGQIMEEIYRGPTCENIRGSLWGGYNAIVEYYDWHRTPRGGDDTSLREAASGFTPSAINTKQDVRKAFAARLS